MKIGFIGAGKMAQALARGIVGSGFVAAENILASAPHTDTHFLQPMAQLGAKTTHDNTEVAQKCDVIFLATKPPLIAKVASEIAPSIDPKKLVVSIALGITIRNIESLLPKKSRVVRVMPNTPVVVRAGASAYTLGSACQEGDSDLVRDMLSCVGYAVEVTENLIDPVTGLSGSGPAYVFCALEALTDGGVKQGLPRDLALKLAAYTLLGSAKMALETGKHPAELREEVQSPGGSAITAIHKLEKAGFRGILMDAVEAASRKSRETGEGAYRPRMLRDD